MDLSDSLLDIDDRQRAPAGTLPRKRKTSAAKWVTHAACFLLAIALGGWVGTSVPAPWHWGASATQTVAADASANARFHTAGIEEVRVGQRLRTAGVSDCQNCATEVDPATWRLVRMRIDDHRLPDGTPDPVDIESLQPLAWIAAHDARPGRHVPVPLDLADMGLPENLACRVVAVDPCPAIESSPGRVVLNTVTHLNNYLFNLVVEDASGRSETIRTTGFHKFRSRTRSEWVSADTLTAGESLEGMSSPLTVASLERVPGTFRVYNLTVEAEHVFRISDLGVLVHNNGCIPGTGTWDTGVQPLTGQWDTGLQPNVAAPAPLPPLSMDQALDEVAGFVGPNPAKIDFTPSGNPIFIDTPGSLPRKVAHLDINPGDAHVQAIGPHINMSTHTVGPTGKVVQVPHPLDHHPIDPDTVRPTDFLGGSTP